MYKNNPSFFKKNRKKIAGVSAANLLTNLLPGISQILLYLIVRLLAAPVLTGTSVDCAALWNCYFWYGGLFIIYLALSMWSQTLTNVNAYTMSADLRMAMGDKLRRLPLSYFSHNDPGDIASRLLSDVQKAETIIARLLPDTAAILVSPVILLVFLATVDVPVTVILLAACAVAGVFLCIAQRIIDVLGKKHIGTITEASSRILEYLKTIKLLKSFNMTGERFSTMNSALLRLKKASFKTEVWATIPVQLFLFCLDAGYLLVLASAVLRCAAGSLSVAGLFSFAFIGSVLFETVKSLGPQIVEFTYISLSVRRIREVFEEAEPPYESLVNPPEHNDIVFDKVSFRYGSSEVLKNASFSIPENSVTALTGISGSGKTTITNLIARFWDVQSGEIRFGGIPINRINPDTLLTRLSMVFQDVYLFNDTIEANIAIGKQGATRDQIRRAAQRACCDSFIRELPDGYETVVSEGGSSLSGGEKQRISIARAILKDAPVVMLDEATASLDPENEADIQQAFENLVSEKTVIAIAHRFRSIEHADRILVLDHGRIVEQGTHEELLKSDGLYAHLWNEQQKSRGWKMTDGSC